MTVSAPDAEQELLPGYYVEPETGAWMSLPWPPPPGLLTIGPQVVSWCETWLQSHREADPETGEPLPWRFTRGQMRYFHLWYALRGPGPQPRWLYRSGVKRGAKGTGKDPMLAVMALAGLCGPTNPVWHNGRWIGMRHRMALVQIAANSEGQAKDPLAVANAMVGKEMAAEYGFDKGILRTQIAGGSKIELLTNSEASAEGDPATEIYLNESHHMTHTSGGQRLGGVARRNVGKSPGGMARVCEFTNAHMPGEGSVAEDSYEAWQMQVAGLTRRADILYDSREAPPHLKLQDEDDLMAGIAAAYADAPWSDPERIRDEAQDPRTPLADSIRFYFSSLPTSEDAWIDPRNFDSKVLDSALIPGTPISLFLDCSKSEDATTLAGCRISDGHVFGLGCWEKPQGERGRKWLAPREEVDAKVRETFAAYDVQMFGVDPSPAKDDDDEALYWKDVIDGWHRDFRDEVLVWTVPGAKGHAVMFDMRTSTPGGKDRVRQITEEAEHTAAAIDDDESFETLTWDGDPKLRVHVHNARRRPNQWGVSIGKQSRGSSKRVDYAVSMVGARLLRRLVLNSGKTRKRRRSGRAVFQ